MALMLLNDRYRILRQLGTGGFGDTFLAEDTYLPSGRRCVVKRLRWGTRGPESGLGGSEIGEWLRSRFEREAALLETLSQAHQPCYSSTGQPQGQIPQLYAHFEQDGEFYLVQEWIEGKTLEERVRGDGPQSAPVTVAWLQAILGVVSQIHQHGVIHRDIKPANLILRADSQSPVLIDFGIAKELVGRDSQLGQPTIMAGTQGYMAPEQAVGHPTFASDLYSLALSGLFGLSGRSPEYLPRCGTGLDWSGLEAALGLGLSPELQTLLDRAIALDWTQRFSTAEAMASALRVTPEAQALQPSEWLPPRIIPLVPPAIPLAPTALPTLQPRVQPGAMPSVTSSVTPSVTPSVTSSVTPSVTPSVTSSVTPSVTPSVTSSVTSSATSSVTPTALPLVSYPSGPQSSQGPPPNQGLEDSHPAPLRDRQILINKVRNYWIKGVLETSLHHQALLQLQLEERRDAVGHPWALAWETPEQRRTLPATMSALDVFEQLGTGRSLLILGEPGSGKTTTLLELGRDLLERAERDPSQSIPVVFNLSTWSEYRPAEIASWLVQELHVQYQVSRDLAQAWLEQQRLLLLLDGLDEVRQGRRWACVQALNQFSQEHGGTELVVCCRREEYEALTQRASGGEAIRLRLQSAIAIQPLTLAQVDRYLAQLGEDLGAVRRALQGDEALQELVRSPLMLTIITLAYQGMGVTELPQMGLQERRRHLFDQYIQRMLGRRGGAAGVEYERALRWLIWLARQLHQRSQTIFLIEQLQPSWLGSRRWCGLYQLGLMLAFVAMLAIAGSFVMVKVRLVLCVIISILIFGPIFGRLQIRTVETLRWSWLKARNTLMSSAILGAVLGLGFKVIYEAILHPLQWQILNPMADLLPLKSVIRGGIFGLSAGLLFGFIRSWSGPGIRRKATFPNQGLWQSFKHSLFFGFFGALFLGTASAAILHGFEAWAMFGWLFGWSLGGGEACLKHGLLRLMLWQQGVIPWNYARFLNWATERIFLQRVGGGYIFVHRLLLEHFAQLPLR